MESALNTGRGGSAGGPETLGIGGPGQPVSAEMLSPDETV